MSTKNQLSRVILTSALGGVVLLIVSFSFYVVLEGDRNRIDLNWQALLTNNRLQSLTAQWLEYLKESSSWDKNYSLPKNQGYLDEVYLLALELSESRHQKKVSKELAAVVTSIAYLDIQAKRSFSRNDDKRKTALASFISVLDVEKSFLFSNFERMHDIIDTHSQADLAQLKTRRYVFAFVLCFLLLLYLSSLVWIKRWASDKVVSPIERLRSSIDQSIVYDKPFRVEEVGSREIQYIAKAVWYLIEQLKEIEQVAEREKKAALIGTRKLIDQFGNVFKKANQQHLNEEIRKIITQALGEVQRAAKTLPPTEEQPHAAQPS